ncbi:hypothetical protein CLV35_0573 [Motilibacter peucedani]|uniref:HTH tetR-type domain-containing protein n=1 Tax=Motilibacter peucedani TaxID=598650 RepID=A0A420XTG4_9ACTN|nr:TetR/AcrR family transcriptional regulator [Motilibacter peucedani]RKS80152.1 hypothetical protein CLV35_0573 [Motilibacter peucedani]
MSRRDQVLEAAIGVTAAGGVRALTHGNVDRAGGLPNGTTSNYFRSRTALLVGTLERLGEGMAAVIGDLGTVTVRNASDVAQVLGANLGAALGPGRVAAGALAALFTEAAVDPSLREVAARTNRLWASAIADMLRAAGVTDDVEMKARYLLSYGNGLVVDQLALHDDDFDPVAAMAAAMRGFGS